MRLVSREVLALREVLEDGEEDLEEANHRSPDQGDSTSIGRAGIAAVFSYAQSARGHTKLPLRHFREQQQR